MCQCKAFAQMVDIWKFAACCLNREKRFLILYSSLIRNSSLFSGSKFRGLVTFSIAGIKTREYNTYVLRWSYKTIWTYFNLIFTWLFKNLIVKMQNICNLIGWNSVHIFDSFTVQISIKCETQESQAGYRKHLNLHQPKTYICWYRINRHFIVLKLDSVLIGKSIAP